MNIGQEVKITPKFQHSERFRGLKGTIKELPLGFVIVEITIPLLADEIESLEADEKKVRTKHDARER